MSDKTKAADVWDMRGVEWGSPEFLKKVQEAEKLRDEWEEKEFWNGVYGAMGM